MEALWQNVFGLLAFDPSRLAAPDMAVRLTLQAFLFVGSAFFSSSETALFSLADVDLEQLRRQRHPRADLIHDLLDQPRQLIISILCGNELINIASTANMTGILIALYGVERAGWISILVMVPLLLLFGEITPKTIAVTRPLQVSTRIVSVPLSLWMRIITPLRWVIRGVSDRVTTWIVGEARDVDHLLRMSEFRSLVADIEEQGLASATDRVLIYNLLEGGSTEVERIMTPRTHIRFVQADLPLAEAADLLTRQRRLRMPVYERRIDEAVGFIHAEDVAAAVRDAAHGGAACRDLLRPCLRVPQTKTVDEMLAFFQQHDERAAIVINEFGGLSGIVTLEDVLDFIFGEIAGDFIDPDAFTKESDHAYQVSGDMKLADFEALTNFGIEDSRMTTIGGVALRHLGRLPEVGDTVAVDNIRLTVLDMADYRITRLKAEKVGELQISGDTAAGEDS